MPRSCRRWATSWSHHARAATGMRPAATSAARCRPSTRSHASSTASSYSRAKRSAPCALSTVNLPRHLRLPEQKRTSGAYLRAWSRPRRGEKPLTCGFRGERNILRPLSGFHTFELFFTLARLVPDLAAVPSGLEHLCPGHAPCACTALPCLALAHVDLL